MGSRRRGREMALQILCLLDRQPDLPVEQALRFYFKHLVPGELDDSEGEAETRQGRDSALEQQAFAESLVRGVRNSLRSIDALLGNCSRNWRLERMSWVDRNLLRLACFELCEHREIPARVVLNESIEIARRYSTTESSGFVNGVLDRVMRELGQSDAPTTTFPPGDHAADPR